MWGVWSWLRAWLGVSSVSDQREALQFALNSLAQETYPGMLDNENDDEVMDDFGTYNFDNVRKLQEEEVREARVLRTAADHVLLEGGLRLELQPRSQPSSLKPGDTVNVRVDREASHHQWRATQLPAMLEIDEGQWGDTKPPSPEEARQAEQDGRAIRKILVGYVESNFARTVTVVPQNLSFSLNTVECNFIPKTGDRVQLTAVCAVEPEASDLEGPVLLVEQVTPLRSQMVEGCITAWRAGRGEIIRKAQDRTENIKVAFDLGHCDPGYLPRVGDLVVADCIESNQGNLNWRALAVVPLLKVSQIPTTMGTDPEEQELLKDREGLKLSRNSYLGTLGYKNTGKLQVLLANRSPLPVKLIAIFPHPRLCPHPQFSLKQCPSFPYFLPSRAEVTILFKCKAKNLGVSSDLFVFEFEGGCRLGCYLHVEVTADDSSDPTSSETVNPVVTTNKGYSRTRKQQAWESREEEEGPVVRGQRIGKLHPFRRRLLAYPVSQTALKLAKDPGVKKGQASAQQALYDYFPWFIDEMSASNYQARLHELLDLEEAEVMEDLQRWGQEKVELIRSECLNYFMLEVPGLSEGRPSLLMGDTVHVRHIHGGPRFEGVIHKTLLNYISLKFHETFPIPQPKDRFFVKFCVSRVPFRRLHAAVDAAWRELGPAMLFPSSRLRLQEPQVELVEEEGMMPVSCHNGVPINKVTLNSESTKDKPQLNIPNVTSLWLGRTPYPDQEKNPVIDMQPPSPVKVPSQVQIPTFVRADCRSPGSTRIPVAERLFNCPSPKPPVSSAPSSAFLYVQNLTGPLPAAMSRPKEPTDVETLRRRFRRRNLQWVNPRLNSSQRNAVCNVLKGEARPLPYIIFGPPGTGKTMTLVETILQLFILFPDARLLIGTPSNSAADLIALRLLDSGRMMPGSLVRLVAFSYKDHLPQRLVPYMGQARGEDLETCETPGAIGWQRITVGTCAALGRLVQSGVTSGHFTHVLIDEAGQATEPESMLVAALMGQPRQLILAGDPMQLGPVIQGRTSNLGGLGVSLLARLLRCGPYIRDPEGFPQTQGYNPLLVTMLVQNYRSVPEILDLPARLFYHGELVSTVSQKHGLEADLLKAMADHLPKRQEGGPPALVFHGVRGRCEREEDSPSWFNAMELNQAAFYISTLYKLGVAPNELGVISPYNKQVQKMRGILYRLGMPIPKVGSVEEFQGQERLAVIFSAVRSSEDCEEEGLGFLSSPNRLNTALTRARALLVVIGDPHLLAQDPTWHALIKYCVARHAYVGCNLPFFLTTDENNTEEPYGDEN